MVSKTNAAPGAILSAVRAACRGCRFRRAPGNLAGGDQLKLRCQDILALEHEADGIAREVLISLRTTFITPFDRVDVQSLISAMDASVDQMQQTAKAIMLFEMVEFEDACELIRRRS